MNLNMFRFFMANEIMTSMQAGYTDRAMTALNNLVRAVNGDGVSNETRRAFVDVSNIMVSGQVNTMLRQ